MLIYASQIKVGDRFHLKLSNFQKQGGRVQNDSGWVRVVVSSIERIRVSGVDVSVVLITEHGQHMNTTLPVTLTLDVESEGGLEYMSKYGDVHYLELNAVV